MPNAAGFDVFSLDRVSPAGPAWRALSMVGIGPGRRGRIMLAGSARTMPSEAPSDQALFCVGAISSPIPRLRDTIDQGQRGSSTGRCWPLCNETAPTPVLDGGLPSVLSAQPRESAVVVRADKVTLLEKFVSLVDEIRGLGFQQVSLEVIRL